MIPSHNSPRMQVAGQTLLPFCRQGTQKIYKKFEETTFSKSDVINCGFKNGTQLFCPVAFFSDVSTTPLVYHNCCEQFLMGNRKIKKHFSETRELQGIRILVLFSRVGFPFHRINSSSAHKHVVSEVKFLHCQHHVYLVPFQALC